MAVKDIIIEETNKILGATELLSALSDKAGQYVWKKTVKIAKIVTNPVIILNGSNGVTKVTSSDFDLSAVDALFFDGFDSGYATNTMSDYRYLVIDGKLYYQWGGANRRYETTYDPATQTLRNNCTGAVDNGSKYGYIGDKTYYAEDKSQTIYLVSDNINEYPNGQEVDGHWYELITYDEESEDVVTGIDYGEVTLTSFLQSITINHNLGVAPRRVVLLPLSISGYNYANIASTDGTDLVTGGNIKELTIGNMDDMVGRLTSALTKADSTSITFKPKTGAYSLGTYIWVAIA